MEERRDDVDSGDEADGYLRQMSDCIRKTCTMVVVRKRGGNFFVGTSSACVT